MSVNARQKILLVEDNEKIGREIKELLDEEGFFVRWLKDGDEAARANPAAYHLIILDLMLPGTYGLDVLKVFRKQADTPVLILSARGETTDKVRGLELGADDYVTKPFWPEELLARIRSRLRRPVMLRGDALNFGELVLRPAAREAFVSDRKLDLTAAEYDLLLTLARRAGQAVTRAQLADEVLDPDQGALDRTLDSHVSRLRKKLGVAASRLDTVWGVGYRLNTEPNAGQS